jgi:ADP-ribose pyrophosphatase YjhB (NUDIX family)
VERELLRRRAARVLVVDAADRLLLLRGGDPAVPGPLFWWTVGGGLEPGESARAAAVRELHEETGLVVAEGDLVGPVHRDVSSFEFDRYRVEQENEFFAVRVEAWTPAPAALDAPELASIDGAGWWTAEQLRAQAAGRPHDGPGRPGEPVYPPDLAAVLDTAVGRSVSRGPRPAGPSTPAT